MTYMKQAAVREKTASGERTGPTMSEKRDFFLALPSCCEALLSATSSSTKTQLIGGDTNTTAHL
jgi:hypothetical protein